MSSPSGGREGRRRITGSVSGGWEFKRPPILTSILHRLKFCCGDYIASARANLPQACRLNSSRDDFEARGSGSCSKKASSATVQPCKAGCAGVVLWWDFGGTVVGLERYPSRCRNLVSRWPCSAGRQKVEWSGIMGWGCDSAILVRNQAAALALSEAEASFFAPSLPFPLRALPCLPSPMPHNPWQ